MTQGTTIPPNPLDWRDSTPYSRQFDDIYFSADNGLLESQYVFLQHNQLAERFAALDKSHFIIGETGFGTGLNFLNSWRLWQQCRKPDKTLIFISTERYPLSKQDLSQCLSLWPALADLSESLIEHYPFLLTGTHAIELADNVVLLLIFDDVLAGLDSLLESTHPTLFNQNSRQIDAWFLDGFSPQKNTAMWQDEVFQRLGKLSHYASTLSTFTCAGFVKRGLEKAGFEISKKQGFGNKKHMLTGRFCGLPVAAEKTTASRRQSHYGDFWPIVRSPADTPKQVLIIGAGIAGCTTALLLAQAGLKVILIDQQAAPLMRASGNGQAVLFPKLSLDHDAFAQFNLFSLLYAWRFYRSSAFSPAFHACGVLDVVQSEQDKALAHYYADFIACLDRQTASQVANSPLASEALFYPQSGFIDTHHLTQIILQQPNIMFIGKTRIEQLRPQEQGWLAVSAQHTWQSDAIILCNAQSANDLLENALPTRNVRGQISRFVSAGLDELNSVVCYNGYITPAQAGHYSCGASFDLHQHSLAFCPQAEQQNLQLLQQHLPAFKREAIHCTDYRVAFRCYSPDYLPITGPVPIEADFLRDYADYRYNAKAFLPKPGSYYSGLWVNNAFGSRGFSTAPICAAIMRAYLLKQPFPLAMDLIKALNPARFIIRDIARKKD